MVLAATRENRSSGFPTRSDTNRAVQAQKMVMGRKFLIYKVKELHYPCSESKGADQLRSYCEADLRLCFRIGKNPVFSWRGSYKIVATICILFVKQSTRAVKIDNFIGKKYIFNIFVHIDCSTRVPTIYVLDQI